MLRRLLRILLGYLTSLLPSSTLMILADSYFPWTDGERVLAQLAEVVRISSIYTSPILIAIAISEFRQSWSARFFLYFGFIIGVVPTLLSFGVGFSEGHELTLDIAAMVILPSMAMGVASSMAYCFVSGRTAGLRPAPPA